MKYPKTNRNLELDIWCEELKLAIEKNGSQHYKIGIYHNPRNKNNLTEEQIMKLCEENFKEQIERDKFKYNKCKELGIELIIIKTTGSGWQDVKRIKNVVFQSLNHRPECIIKDINDPWLQNSEIEGLENTKKSNLYKNKLLNYINDNNLGYKLVNPNIAIVGVGMKFEMICPNGHQRTYVLDEFISNGKRCFNCRKRSNDRWYREKLEKYFEYLSFKIKFNFIDNVNYNVNTYLGYICKVCNEKKIDTRGKQKITSIHNNHIIGKDFGNQNIDIIGNIISKIKRKKILCDCDNIMNNNQINKIMTNQNNSCYFTNIKLITPYDYKFIKYKNSYVMVCNFIHEVFNYLEPELDIIDYFKNYDINDNPDTFNAEELQIREIIIDKFTENLKIENLNNSIKMSANTDNISQPIRVTTLKAIKDNKKILDDFGFTCNVDVVNQRTKYDFKCNKCDKIHNSTIEALKRRNPKCCEIDGKKIKPTPQEIIAIMDRLNISCDENVTNKTDVKNFKCGSCNFIHVICLRVFEKRKIRGCCDFKPIHDPNVAAHNSDELNTIEANQETKETNIEETIKSFELRIAQLIQDFDNFKQSIKPL